MMSECGIHKLRHNYFEIVCLYCCRCFPFLYFNSTSSVQIQDYYYVNDKAIMTLKYPIEL